MHIIAYAIICNKNSISMRKESQNRWPMRGMGKEGKKFLVNTRRDPFGGYRKMVRSAQRAGTLVERAAKEE